MRRISIEQARAAGLLPSEAVVEPPGEVLVLEVHGGEVVVVVPEATSDVDAVARARLVRGMLNLENERVLILEIRERGAAADFRDEPIALAERNGGPEPRRTTGWLGGNDLRQATAADIMTREVLTTGPDVPVREFAKRLQYHRISGMPVVDRSGAVVGIVSEADLISKRGTTVGDLMVTDVISVREDMPALEVAALLTHERIKRVPVLRDGRLVGLIGRSNIVSWVASHGGLPSAE